MNNVEHRSCQTQGPHFFNTHLCQGPMNKEVRYPVMASSGCSICWANIHFQAGVAPVSRGGDLLRTRGGGGAKVHTLEGSIPEGGHDATRTLNDRVGGSHQTTETPGGEWNG